MPDKIKTMLIDDSGFMRIMLSDHLRRDGRIDVVATATDGRQGVEKALNIKPDVVVTDMLMPEYDGLYVVRELMRQMPLPIILLSSLERSDPKVFDALREGAFHFLDKPKSDSLDDDCVALASWVTEAHSVDCEKLRRRSNKSRQLPHTFAESLNYDIIAIGASTGGPGAIETIVHGLPANFAVPVIIAQHMPEKFIESFALRLSESSGFVITVAEDGQNLQPNRIYLAPGNMNTRLVRVGDAVCVRLTPDRYREFNDPSVDCLLESVAETYSDRAIGIILSGMGRDGTRGLARMRSRGALTIAQDESSSVVFGMPRSAYESGAASRLIPESEIANFIITAL